MNMKARLVVGCIVLCALALIAVTNCAKWAAVRSGNASAIQRVESSSSCPQGEEHPSATGSEERLPALIGRAADNGGPTMNENAANGNDPNATAPVCGDFLEAAMRELGLDTTSASQIRQVAGEALDEGRRNARAARTVLDSPDGTQRTFDFPPDQVSAAELRNRLSAVVRQRLQPAAAEQLLSIWEGAGEDDPSLDMLQHQRRIAIIASGEGSGWKVTDQTVDAEGEVIAAKVVFLGIDEEGALVWPEEYQILLSE